MSDSIRKHLEPASALLLALQNENLVARLLPGSAATHLAARHGAAAQGSGEQGGAWQGGVVLTTVPDLICCVQDESEYGGRYESEYGRRAYWQAVMIWQCVVRVRCCLPACAAVRSQPAAPQSQSAAPTCSPVMHVPGLLLSSAAGLPIATEELRYGLRAAVLGLPAHPLLTTPEALAVVGPAAFGHPGVAYAPLAQYVPPAGIPRT